MSQERLRAALLWIADSLSSAVPGEIDEDVVIRRDAFLKIVERVGYALKAQLRIAQHGDIFIANAELARDVLSHGNVLHDARQRRSLWHVVLANRHDERMGLSLCGSAERH